MSEVKFSLLNEILDNSFSLNKFQKFTREFFNRPNMMPANRDDRIWLEYRESILAYYKIATYKDGEDNNILILAVELKKGTTVERARSLQRNFISKILDNSVYGAAIVAFYTPDESNWRLSLVRLDYSLTDKGIKLDLTPARRYSYLVGENEPKHTAVKQLFSIFENDERNPSLDEIEEAFSVERVTKDFYNEYKRKYLDLKEHLEENEDFIKETKNLGLDLNKFAEQFSKKLMGQLSFLYFLQKKGWLGVRILPQNRELSREEFGKIYNSVDSIKQNILKKVLKSTDRGTIVATADDLHSLDEHEAELLSDCFINTRYNMPWGSGDRSFIRGLFDFCDNNTELNYFNDYLEPFFYDALNKKRKNHYFTRFNCKIPFLNGGLFEPIEDYHWKDVNFKIPNYIFSNKKDKDREADGILDIFDMYNFTMNEDEPFEKEVAIDPEMLGKIFENLLDVSDRKSKGAFYTPREIVHYMCQESLINYLVNKVDVPYEDIKEFILYGEIIKDADNRKVVRDKEEELSLKDTIYDNIVKIDKALEHVKVADPAVGSGAFPLGMLSEIVKARNNITEYIIKANKEGKLGRFYTEKQIRDKRSEYEIKLKTIQNSIFAVDIEASAVDIAKLRLWLSLVVDQDIDERNIEPHPLPNLDLNIKVGNSLIDEFEGIKLFDETLLYRELKGDKSSLNTSMQINMLLDHSDELLDDMFKLQDSYFSEEDEKKKKQIKKDIDRIQNDLIMHKLTRDKNLEGLRRYEESLKNKTKPYFIWELEFAHVFKKNDGFDIVIGNPPYVDNETIDYIQKEIYKKNYMSAIGHYDIYVIFYEKGFRILKTNGILSFITSNKWMAQKYGYALRRILLFNKMIKLLDFNKLKNFETATVDTQVTIVAKTTNLSSYKTYKKLPILEYEFEGYYHRGDKNLNLLDINYDRIETSILDVTNELNFKLELSRDDLDIIKKIRKDTILFEKICYVTLGAVIHCKESQNTKDEFLYDFPRKGYKRYYEGKDINKWIMKKTSKFLDYKPDMHREPRFKELFENTKIVSIRMSTQQNPHRFALEEGGYIADSAIVSINYNNIKDVDNRNLKSNIRKTDIELCSNFNDKYLLGILNSNLMYWYFFKIFSDGLHFYPSHLKQIPIKLASLEVQKEIANLVDRLIIESEMKLLNENNLNVDSIIYNELNLNKLIYNLYGINECEIRNIESFLKS